MSHGRETVPSFYVLKIPPEILDSLSLKREQAGFLAGSSTQKVERGPQDDDAQLGCCTSCGISRPLPAFDLKRHRQSDWHHYNVKRKDRGQKTVDENEFERIVEDLEESISGSDTESGDDDGNTAQDDGLPVDTHLDDMDGVDGSTTARTPNSPLLWFESPRLPVQPTFLGVYRNSVPESTVSDPLAALRRVQLSARDASVGRTATLIMVGGGHFAASVISLAPSKKSGYSIQDRPDVLAHKTFHRYTTRRKQGGSQSAADSGKGGIHSAGSALRRYNEVALASDVQNLLKEWQDLIRSTELIFVRATGHQNRKMLYEFANTPLDPKDKRIKNFPFSTKRPTQSELERCFKELFFTRVSHIDLEAIQKKEEEQRQAKIDARRADREKSKKEEIKVDPEESKNTRISQELLGVLRRGKAPLLLSTINSYSLSPDFRLAPASAHHHDPTLLHVAAASCNSSTISALLNAGADPTVKNESGKTAFDLAGNRAARDAFRLYRHHAGEEKWGWDAAHVPPPLSPEEVSKREASERQAEETEANERAKEREALLKQANEREQRERCAQKGTAIQGQARKVGAQTSIGANASQGIPPEMKARIDRERRAAAAEARMKKLSMNSK